MSVQANPFQRTTIAIMFAVGFAAFVALLYGLGMGDPLASGKNGDAHGASNSIIGYKAFANLLEKTGVPVQYSRSPAGMDNEGLLILTPGPFTPTQDIDAVVQQRWRARENTGNASHHQGRFHSRNRAGAVVRECAGRLCR